MGTEYVAIAFTILSTIATSLLLGRYMFHVFTGRWTLLDPILCPIERLVLRTLDPAPITCTPIDDQTASVFRQPFCEREIVEVKTRYVLA